MFRCKPACAPLFSCAHSIVKLRAMVIHVRVYARRLTIHIHFTQAQPCRNYRYMPRSWPYTELRNGKKRGIDQSETSSHLTHLIYSDISLDFWQHIQKRRNFNAKVTCQQSICFIIYLVKILVIDRSKLYHVTPRKSIYHCLEGLGVLSFDLRSNDSIPKPCDRTSNPSAMHTPTYRIRSLQPTQTLVSRWAFVSCQVTTTTTTPRPSARPVHVKDEVYKTNIDCSVIGWWWKLSLPRCCSYRPFYHPLGLRKIFITENGPLLRMCFKMFRICFMSATSINVALRLQKVLLLFVCLFFSVCHFDSYVIIVPVML